MLSPKRSRYLGMSEIRYKPEVQFRRDVYNPGTSQQQLVSRTMFLPLTFGMRWHVTPRQRFTFYVGPRFDFLAYSDPGTTKHPHRGGSQIGPMYGEAWYDLDVPFTEHPRRNGAMRRASVVGMLSLGYIHSRFNGQGFNFGPVIGFLGPIPVEWYTKVRPRGRPVALQGMVGATIGNGATVNVRVGVILPALGDKRQ